jgi:hypothetical protein
LLCAKIGYRYSWLAQKQHNCKLIHICVAAAATASALLKRRLSKGVLREPFIIRLARRLWLWCGIALAFVILLPNFLWQIRHHLISLDFLKSIHVRDIRIGRTETFVLDQFWIASKRYRPIVGCSLSPSRCS